MNTLSFHSNYLFHGLSIYIAADNPLLRDALHTRLRQFVTPVAPPPDIVLEAYTVPDVASHVVNIPETAGRTIYDHTEGVFVYDDAAGRLFISYGERARAECLPSQGWARISVVESEAASPWLISHPLFIIPFMELLKHRGMYSLHAASLCVDGRGLLFPGASGSGKSTLTVALVRAGLGFMGDDTLFLSHSSAGVRMHAFPDEIDLTDQTAEFFPELHYVLESPRVVGWHKRAVKAETLYQVDFVPECSPAAIVFPRIAHTDVSVLTPMGKSEALTRLAPNILLTSAVDSQHHLDMLSALVTSTPCYRLDTGRDFAALPDMLSTLVA